MKGQAVVFSKGKDNWQTPYYLFYDLHEEFDFTIDGAADESNHLCANWLGPGSVISEDALVWRGSYERIFVNPPYSMVKQFVQWAAESAGDFNTVVMLVPARTDTKWWHEFVWDRKRHEPMPGVRVRFLKGRVKFVDPAGTTNNSAPFPSVVIVFTPDYARQS